MTTELPTADVLRQAADRIEAEGFWQGDCSVGGKTGGQCAVTAISPGRDDAIDALQAHLGFLTVSDVIRWNDAASSAEVVTSKLRSCADALDSQGDETTPESP